MSQSCTDAPPSSSATEVRIFANYGLPQTSPILALLPTLLAWSAAAGTAAALCPLPRSHTISVPAVLLISSGYVAATGAAGAVAFAAAARAFIPSKFKLSFRFLLRLSGSAAWFAPIAAFYARHSLWATVAAAVLGAATAGWTHRRYAGIEDLETNPTAGKHRTAMVLAALLLQLTVVFAITGMTRAASVSMAGTAFLLVWFRAENIEADRSPADWRVLAMSGLAVAVTAASLTPFLASKSGTSRWPQAGNTQDHPQTNEESQKPYPVLQAIFGEGGAASESEPASKTTTARRLTILSPGDSYKGMILRPKVVDDVRILPPRPMRLAFSGNQTARKRAEPVSIPFYGVYWFFRTFDETLPPGAVESRGDPATQSFRTTDFTPMSMEARQIFGSPIDLSCCQSIQVVISNGDRHPNTVSAELILINTGLPGKPSQSLGTLPVNSTLKWKPGDDRPPVSEILNFRIPPGSPLKRFDEAVLRFELRFPRQISSAKMAIDRFRLIPRGF